jgi:hypothetical protein
MQRRQHGRRHNILRVSKLRGAVHQPLLQQQRLPVVRCFPALAGSDALLTLPPPSFRNNPAFGTASLATQCTGNAPPASGAATAGLSLIAGAALAAGALLA